MWHCFTVECLEKALRDLVSLPFELSCQSFRKHGDRSNRVQTKIVKLEAQQTVSQLNRLWPRSGFGMIYSCRDRERGSERLEADISSAHLRGESLELLQPSSLMQRVLASSSVNILPSSACVRVVQLSQKAENLSKIHENRPVSWSTFSLLSTNAATVHWF